MAAHSEFLLCTPAGPPSTRETHGVEEVFKHLARTRQHSGSRQTETPAPVQKGWGEGEDSVGRGRAAPWTDADKSLGGGDAGAWGEAWHREDPTPAENRSPGT